MSEPVNTPVSASAGAPDGTSAASANAPVNALGGARFDGIVTIEELPPRGMITLRGDHADPGLKNAATGLARVDMPAQRKCHGVGSHVLCWLSPDELLLVLPRTEVPQAFGAIEKTLAGSHHLAVDVSDARAMFRISGKDALVREVIAKLAPVDMAPSQFGPGDMRRTHLAQVAAAFWMTQEGEVELICFRSVAQYVFDLLSNAAAEGSEVAAF